MDEEIITDIDVELAISLGFKFDDDEIDEPDLFTRASVERACSTIIRKK